MKPLIATLACTLLGFSHAALAQQKMEEIGNLRPRGHLVSLMVMTLVDKPVAGLYVADSTGIKTNLVPMDRAQLLKLRELIDQTAAALEKAEAAAAAPK